MNTLMGKCKRKTYILLIALMATAISSPAAFAAEGCDGIDNDGQNGVDDAAEDSTLPTISCPGDSSVECVAPAAVGASDLDCALAIISSLTITDPTNTGSATASDDCPGVTVAFSDAVVAGTCSQEKEITRTWTATDAAGNIAECTQIVSVVDNTAPSITCPANTTVQCGGTVANSADGSCIPSLVSTLQATSPANTGSASATDVCDPNPAISFSDSSNGACPDVVTRTWTATDGCGNSTD